MEDSMWKLFVIELGESGMEFDAGLAPSEIADAEGRYGFRFPPDLKAFLQAGLPSGEGFPDWRSRDESTIRSLLDEPRQGLLRGVLEHGYWLEEWGTHPTSDREAERVVNQLVGAAPVLIPIRSGWSSRMMPAEPHLPGNPVFAIRGFDFICRGMDLRDYLIHDFMSREDVNLWPMPSTVRRIPFWDPHRFFDVYWGRTKRST